MPESKTQGKKKRKKSPWQRTTMPCLIRYAPNGKYYLRARFKGEPVRECLHTTVFKTAGIKLGERLAELRAGAFARSGDEPRTLQEALALVRVQVASNPALKPGTRRSYAEELDDMMPGWPAALPEMPLAKFSQFDAARWWEVAAREYAPQRANHLLMFLRRALKLARKLGVMTKDPTEELKRMKIPKTKLNLPTLAQFADLVASIRGQRKAHSEQAGDWVEFMAYSGQRPKEIREVLVTDLLEEVGAIRVTGGEDLTKNRMERYIPMIPPMFELLKRMRAAGRLPQVGRLFTIQKPHDALRNACKRLGIPHQRIYDLRHLFATTCLESGVDVPTFAGWLGHRDGGGLAMGTYVHPRSAHAARSAAKVKF